MTYREALRGSKADRDLWKWERMKEAEEMERTFRSLGHLETAEGWRKEAARYRAMLKPTQ